MSNKNNEDLIMKTTEYIEPKVGMEATEYLFSDRYGGEIVEVKSPNKIGFRAYGYTQTNTEGDCTLNKKEFIFEVEYFTRRKNGGWYKVGQGTKFGSVHLGLGKAQTYIDRGF